MTWVARPEKESALSTSPTDDRGGHDPFAALRQVNFRWLEASRAVSATGQTLFQAAIAWQVYEVSGSALQIGLLGLARFIPSLGLSLVGGAVADSYDRRRILMVAGCIPLISAIAILFTTISGVVNLPLIYAVALFVALANSFENPARQALVPLVVRRETFANAVAVNSTVQQLGFVLGPALSGILIKFFEVEGAYAVFAALTGTAILLLIPIRPAEPTGERRKVSFAAIREGVSFVAHRQVLLGAMSLDMFAVILGGATALLPIYAEDILQVGAGGYGLLTSSQAIGAFGMSLLLVALPPIRRTGGALLISVAAFGLATLVFGISRSFPLSLLAYGLTGVMDQVSVVMRQTTIQLATPDELRGRVSSVGSVFVGASNQVGSIRAGLVAEVTSPTFSVVSGGFGCIAVVLAIAALMPELRRYTLPGREPSPQSATPTKSAR